jgi:hypothetical protein
MYDQASIFAEISVCIDRINEQLPPEQRIAKLTDTVLFGPGSTLDSLTLINLMVEVEEAVNAAYRKRFSILEDALMHKDGAQFYTLGELAKWIAERTA